MYKMTTNPVMTISDLLYTVLSSYMERIGGKPTKTKLLKLAYLAEVEYMRQHRKRLTDASWIYFLYGPYIDVYDDILNQDFEVEEVETEDEYTALLVSSAHRTSDREPSYDSKMAVSAVVNEFGSLTLKDLLNHVYFETEPMIAVERRGQPLDFSTVMLAEYYKVIPLTIPKKAEREIREKYRQRARDRHGESGHS